MTAQAMQQPTDPRRARRNVILAWAHVAFALACLVGFIVAQYYRSHGG